MTKREIYYVIFNKFTGVDGRPNADSYMLEIECAFQAKTPQSITIKDNRVTVTFTDKTRHVFPYNENVEFFDRIIEDKKDGKTENNTD